jgi:superfamily II RNA helicase
MITKDLDNQMCELHTKMSKLQTELDNLNNNLKNLRTPREVIDEYIELNQTIKFAVNKKRKEMERKLQSIKDGYKFIDHDQASFSKITEKEQEMNALQRHYDSLNTYFKSGVGSVLELLNEEGFIEGDNADETSLKLTLHGKIACQIREIHCLAFATLYNQKKLETLSAKQLVALFSCFTNIRVADDFKDNVPKSDDVIVNTIVNEVENLYNGYYDKEVARNIKTGFDYEIHYDLLNYVEKWCETENVEDCKYLLQELGSDKEIFLGEFVKALLKINNISAELEKIAEMTSNIAFLSKLKEIPNMTLKYVVTNQSLYV